MDTDDLTCNQALLFRAPYVLPVALPMIADGGVLVRDGRIVGVDRFSRLQRDASKVIDLDGRIITPALINCHAHLELSYLAPLWESDASAHAPGDMTAWIRALLAKRAEDVSADLIIQAGKEASASLHRRGVVVVADIGNRAASQAIGMSGNLEHLFFDELIGSTKQAAQIALEGLIPERHYTAHAPYSCHPHLLQALKGRARNEGGMFPIHVAESADEIEYLRTGSGPFHDFLAERLRLSGVLADGQALAERVFIPGCGAVEYLHSLGVLDTGTICVHLVHISAHEVDLVAETGAQVCLCPGSNRRLGVGRAKVEWLIERHILPGLGTDSLASNDCLDLWQEMTLLQQDNPGLDPERIFLMATLGGAKTLHLSHRFGSLSPGREAKLLAIPFTGPAVEVYSYLVNAGRTIAVEWLETGYGS